MSAQAKVPFTVKGRHVLFGVVGFFAVVIALDSLFVTWAVQTFPGEVSTRAYEDGLAYNRTLAARQEQKALGWTAKVLQGAQPGAVRVAFAGPSGETLDG
ncbi:MAG TPA: FixH family protein, partial [Caulobacteraceae bacterium]|nr:FixH family protein [Caulobacteraceae bacterium]